MLRIVDDTINMNKGIFEMQKSIFQAIAQRMQRRKSDAPEADSITSQSYKLAAAATVNKYRKKKQMKNYDTFRYLKQCFPTFSGSTKDFIVNYLVELEFILRLAPTSGKVKLGMSPRRNKPSSSILHEKLPYAHELYPYM